MINQPTYALKDFTDMSGVVYQDIYLDSNNNIAVISDIFSVSQTVKNAISMWMGEYQFNTTLYIAWQNIIGVNPLNKVLLNNYIRNTVLAVPYVTSLVSIEYFPDDKNRILNIRITYLNADSRVSIVNVNI